MRRRATYRHSLDFCDFRNVFLVVDAVTQHIAEVSQRTLERICGAFFLGLLKGCSFAFTVFDVAVSNVLSTCERASSEAKDPVVVRTYFVVCAILQSNPNDHG